MARKKRREPETATIAAVTHDGRGIAAIEGKKVFVAGALEGESVTFKRRKFRRNFDEAELLEIHARRAARTGHRLEQQAVGRACPEAQQGDQAAGRDHEQRCLPVRPGDGGFGAGIIHKSRNPIPKVCHRSQIMFASVNILSGLGQERAVLCGACSNQQVSSCEENRPYSPYSWRALPRQV